MALLGHGRQQLSRGSENRVRSMWRAPVVAAGAPPPCRYQGGPMTRIVDPAFPERLRVAIAESGASYRALAARTFYSRGYLHDLATGRKIPTQAVARRIDEALGLRGVLAALVSVIDFDAGELARRVAASDVSDETLERLEAAVDDLAVAYTL